MPGEIQSIRSKEPVKVSTVMTHGKTREMIDVISGVHRLIAKVIYR